MKDRQIQNESIQFRRLDALLTISETIGKASSLHGMLQDALEVVIEVTGMDAGGVRLLDKSKECFRLVGHWGMSPEMQQKLTCIPSDRGFPGAAALKEAPVYTSDIAEDERTTAAEFSTPLGYRALVSVPLLAEGRVLGTMELSTRKDHDWSRDEIRWLATIGKLVGISIQQMKQSEFVLSLAMLQERGRLGREIHDGLAQLLGTLPLWVDEARAAMEAGETDKLLAALQKIEVAANDAQASTREEILGLRTRSIQESGLSEILRDFLERFSRQWGLQTELTLANKDWILQPTAEIQVLRVIQEALSNVRRHAEAQHVEIEFREENGELLITVCDDGIGFAPDLVGEGHHGLRIMEERVRSVGGQMNINSAVGIGTKIKIKVPLAIVQSGWEGE